MCWFLLYWYLLRYCWKLLLCCIWKKLFIWVVFCWFCCKFWWCCWFGCWMLLFVCWCVWWVLKLILWLAVFWVKKSCVLLCMNYVYKFFVVIRICCCWCLIWKKWLLMILWCCVVKLLVLILMMIGNWFCVNFFIYFMGVLCFIVICWMMLLVCCEYVKFGGWCWRKKSLLKKLCCALWMRFILCWKVCCLVCSW